MSMCHADYSDGFSPVVYCTLPEKHLGPHFNYHHLLRWAQADNIGIDKPSDQQ